MDDEIIDRTSRGGDNPVDNIVDLGLINYVKHPSNPDYIVYRFADKNRADSFEELLTNNKVWYERSSQERRQKTFHLFGIHKRDFNKTTQFNFEVEGQHKKPIIPFRMLRWLLLIFSAIVMTLAIMGYCESRNELERVNETLSSVNWTANDINKSNLFSLFAL